MGGYARHVLVIEDDAETAEQLVDCLRTSGYEVDLAADGEDGLRRALAADYVVMTVDRMLPRIDGIEVIRRLRQEGNLTPALILSALGEVDDRVRGLRAGGDDYLVKPFAFREMLARVVAVEKSNCCRESFACWRIWLETPVRWSRAPCFCSMCGICISIRRPTSSMFMSAAFAEKS